MGKLFQKYCTKCGREIKEIISDHTNITRYHPMYGQKQFQRIWMRVCPKDEELFSGHYYFETNWKWIDEEQEKE